MKNIVENYCELPTIVRRPMWQIWHKLMIIFDKDITANFMNYGYENLNGETALCLIQNDEKDRYCIQLYNHVAEKADMKDKDVVEIGSGRGGGASFLSRYYDPKSYTAMDISESVISFCNNYYQVPVLSFVKGVAEEQPFSDGSFNIAINVESARCYRNLGKFFREVYRVLRPGGKFMFADMIRPADIPDIKFKLSQSGFNIISESNITKNVIKSLDHDTERRERLVRQKVPGFLVKAFDQFAATKGTSRYESFTSGKYEYWSYVLKRMN